MRILVTLALTLSLAGPAGAAHMVRACPKHEHVCWQRCIPNGATCHKPKPRDAASGLPTGQRMH
jgi:hypothetical protein